MEKPFQDGSTSIRGLKTHPMTTDFAQTRASLSCCGARAWRIEFCAARVSKRLIAGNRSLTRAILHKLRGAMRRQTE
ncbi:MAG: hypothetical protein KA368_03080 [Acidobacteria bacterium]|nr:hypothetical protein [Acidobacteriota bacterium]